MNLKLSYRDKVIFIVVMVILVLVAGFFLLIKPKFESVESARSALETKQQEKADVDAKIETFADIVKNTKAAATEIGEEQEIFLEEVNPYENEMYLRDLLSGVGAEFAEVNCTETSAQDITYYDDNATARRNAILTYDEKTNADLFGDQLSQEYYDKVNGVPLPEYASAKVGTVTATIKLKTDASKLLSVIYKAIDTIEADENTILLQSVSTNTDDYEESDEQPTAELTVLMYSIEHAPVDRILADSEDINEAIKDVTVPAESEEAAE